MTSKCARHAYVLQNSISEWREKNHPQLETIPLELSRISTYPGSVPRSRKSVALVCRPFRGSHTTDKIAYFLKEIYTHFGILTRSTLVTVTDNNGR